MKKRYNSKFYKSPIIVESINGDILVYIKTSLGKEIIYSGYDTVNKKCHIPYINKCLLGGFIRGTPENVLILGLGGGSFAKYLEDHISSISITGIDIDKVMIDISKKEMGVKSKKIIHGKAEEEIIKLYKKNKIFDLILIDCYSGNGEVPKEIMSLEFFENCNKILSKRGVVSINMSEFYLDDNYENISRVEKYRKMHENIKKVFGKYFSLLLVGEENSGNCMGIYNLDKYYNGEDFNDTYLENVEIGKVKFDGNLIKDIFIDDGFIYLS